jgi:hypothetical protein
MTAVSAELRTLPTQPDARKGTEPHAELRKFVRVALPFSLGLLLAVFGADVLLGVVNARQRGGKIIGRDVDEAIQAAHRPGERVRTLYLGDSVARQMFRPGTEPRDDVRYATSNYAISPAGQYYLLEEALRSCPNTREVNLIVLVGLWGHDLGPPFTDDYFCGHFHSAGQVAEVWRLKKDLRLSTVHASRWLLPNLLGVNAARRPQGPVEPPPPQAGRVGGWLAPAEGEPLLRVLDRFVDKPNHPNPMKHEVTPDGAVVVPLSATSRYYLGKMRALCREKGVRLRVLPGPHADVGRYHDARGIYDGGFLYIDPAKLADGTHMKPQFLAEVRAKVMEAHGLDPATTPKGVP